KSHTVSSEDVDSEREADYESEDENLQSYFIEDEYTMTLEQAEISRRLEMEPRRSFTGHSSRTSQQFLGSELRRNSTFYPSVFSSPSTPDMDDTLVPPSRPFVEPENRLSNASV